MTFKIHNLQANVFWNALKKQIWTSILVTVINESKSGMNKIPVARSLFCHLRTPHFRLL